MSDNSFMVDQHTSKVLFRSCRTYDQEDATSDNPITVEQCTSDVLSNRENPYIKKFLGIKKVTREMNLLH